MRAAFPVEFMHSFKLCCLCLAAILFGLAPARAANEGTFRIADWTGRAYFKEKDKKQKEREFDRCSAQMTNPDRISIIYSLDRHFMWTFELSSEAWNFPKGSSFEVAFGSGTGAHFRQRVAALEPQLLRVLLPDSINSFETFRRLVRLELVAGGLTTRFDTAYANLVLTALTKCVTRYGSTPRSRAAIAAFLKSPIGPASAPSSDPAILTETAELAKSLVAEANLPKAESLKPANVPDGMPGDAVWKIADAYMTVSVLPREHVPSEIGDLTDLIVGADAQKCRGDFFSGTTLDLIDAVNVARAYTNCETQQATSSIHYLLMPRAQGGLYLIRSIISGVEVTPVGERAVKELDAKIRGSIMAALAKM
ncbi:MAG TPA: hypothetical protein VFP60_16170 [Pseudolabrys sp.]|nr:hypothetical protein [Pseudolabrys sp.]